MKKIILAIAFGVTLWSGFTIADAQAVCDTNAAPTTSVCNGNNNLSWIMPTTNTNGTPFNDFASVRAIFGPNPTLCTAAGVPTTGTTVRNLGALGQPPSPVPNTTVTTKLSTVNPSGGLNHLAVQVLDLTGNISPCSPGIQFTFDDGIPSSATGVKAGP